MEKTLQKRIGEGPRDILEENEIPKLDPGLTVISGKPGSGKTRLLIELVKKDREEGKILILTPTHSILNGICARITQKRVIVSSEYKVSSQNSKHHVSLLDGYSEERKAMVPTTCPKVILSTVNHVISNGPELDISMVLVDEASRISVIELLAAIQDLRDLKYLVFIGDNLQLGAMDSLGHNQVNIIEWAFRHRGTKTFEMSYQYRFGNPLNFAISEVIYGGIMKTKVQPTPVSWIVVNCEGESCESNVSCKFEIEEALKVINANAKEFQFLTPYKAQLNLFRKQKDCAGLGLNSDLCQGLEYENTIVSIGRHKGFGFLTKERLNVTLTRCRNSMTVVVNKNILNTHPVLARIYDLTVPKD